MSILSGLDKLGLGKLEKMDVFAKPEKEEHTNGTQSHGNKPGSAIPDEKDFLFDKSFTCPVCDNAFKARTLRSSRARLLKTDMDLRPIYEYIEPMKYDVVSCPHCGYTALTRYYSVLMESQIKMIQENISKAYHPGKQEQPETYSYPEAINRYKLCLANAIVKHAKASEKAYICLKAGWLIRSMEDQLETDSEDHEKELKELEEQQNEFLKNALEGFTNARMTEGYPMCGMDEMTIDYLLAVLSMRFGQNEVAAKLISQILISSSANPRIKDKARDAKEILMEQMKKC